MKININNKINWIKLSINKVIFLEILGQKWCLQVQYKKTGQFAAKTWQQQWDVLNENTRNILRPSSLIPRIFLCQTLRRKLAITIKKENFYFLSIRANQVLPWKQYISRNTRIYWRSCLLLIPYLLEQRNINTSSKRYNILE